VLTMRWQCALGVWRPTTASSGCSGGSPHPKPPTLAPD